MELRPSSARTLCDDGCGGGAALRSTGVSLFTDQINLTQRTFIWETEDQDDR